MKFKGFPYITISSYPNWPLNIKSLSTPKGKAKKAEKRWNKRAIYIYILIKYNEIWTTFASEFHTVTISH